MVLFGFVSVPAGAADLTGTWNFSVDLENGQHGDPVFVLKQLGSKLTGTYRGPFGDQEVIGTLKGQGVVLEVASSGAAGTVKLTYHAIVQGEDRISGTMTRDVSGKITSGTWTGSRKE